MKYDSQVLRCGCGRIAPMREGRPLYTVWDGGVSFGKLTTAGVCGQCYISYCKEVQEELGEDY